MKKTIALFFLCCSFLFTYSQSEDKTTEKAAKHLQEYYSLNRENIHIHFNKNIYFTGEQIWLSGYVYNQQQQQLFKETTNVFMEMYNSESHLIEKRLLFSDQGTFQTNIRLNEHLSSGKYYFRFYTDYMNNFSEDLSSVFEVSIINPSDSDYSPFSSSDLSALTISAYPESGVFLEGISNTIGVKITDCSGQGVKADNIKVLGSKNEEISSFSTNKYGYGKFVVIDAKNTGYRIEATVNGKTFSETLPKPTSGISLSVMSYASANQTHFTVKSSGIDLSKNYFLIINQNEKFVLKQLDIQKNENVFSVENSGLFNGVNTARIVDEDFNLISERLFFLNKIKLDGFTILHNYNKGNTAVITLKPDSDKSVLSTSVLPEGTESLNTQGNIFNSLLITPYTKESSLYDSEYFNDNSRTKKYELDLFFLYQKSKTEWNDIKNKNLPKTTYPFNFGVSLKGKINQEIKNKSQYKVALFSIEAELDETTSIDENNEFLFENLILADSIQVNFSLVNYSNRKTVPLKTYVRILDNYKKFNKPVNIPKKAERTLGVTDNDVIEFPQLYKDAFLIKAVEIEKTQPKLSREEQFLGARGFKASELIHMKGRLVVDFLEMQGFYVVRNFERIDVYSSKLPISLRGGLPTPQVFIDGVMQANQEHLSALRMDEVDEIYYDRYDNRFVVPTINNHQGFVRIYLNRGGIGNNNESNASEFKVKNGFSKKYEFTPPKYAFYGSAFEKFGILYWKPEVKTDEKTTFEKLNIPIHNQKAVKIFTEGITSEGKLISEIRIVKLD